MQWMGHPQDADAYQLLVCWVPEATRPLAPAVGQVKIN